MQFAVAAFWFFVFLCIIGGGNPSVGFVVLCKLIWLALLLFSVWQAYRHRDAIIAWIETILRWVYFLTPHPAAHMVENAIERGVELDGQSFAELMRPVPGGRIEKEVRAEQAHKLATRAYPHCAYNHDQLVIDP